MDAFSSVAHHNSLQLMQHEAVWSLPPQGDSEGPTFITRTAPITRRPITYLSIGLLSLFGTHAVAKSPYTRLTSSNGPVDRLAPRVVRGRGADRLTVTSLCPRSHRRLAM